MSLASLLVHTCTIDSESESRGAAGSASFTHAAGSDIRCRVQPVSSSERIKALQRGTDITHVIYFDTDPGAEENDEITFDGRTLTVMARARNTDELDRLWRLEAFELDQEQA